MLLRDANVRKLWVRRLIELGIMGRDLFINTLAAALAVATRYREVISLGKLGVDELVDKYVYPAASIGLAMTFARKSEVKDGVRSPIPCSTCWLSA